MNPLENLGDYNIVRNDLFNCGGDVDKLYKDIGDTAVAEKTPALLAKGGVIGGVIVLIIGFGTQAIIKGIRFMKGRKKLIAEKPQLEQQLVRQTVKNAEHPKGAPVEADDEYSGGVEYGN